MNSYVHKILLIKGKKKQPLEADLFWQPGCGGLLNIIVYTINIWQSHSDIEGARKNKDSVMMMEHRSAVQTSKKT